jgi:threonine aldolase
VGDKDFIARLKINRQMLGGMVCKPGVVASAGLVALRTMTDGLAKDNEIARILASKLV